MTPESRRIPRPRNGAPNIAVVVVLAAGSMLPGTLRADVSGAPAMPTQIPRGQKNTSSVPSGTYALDPNHVGVIARVSHLGFSYSVFRFGHVTGTLQWDHEAPGHSKLTADVETASIETNVEGFAKQLSGDQYLKSATYPEASFVSTSFHQTDATHGHVDGQFTLMGRTAPVTFDVTLVGAGPGFAGGPVIGHVIGIHAETAIKPQDFGLPPLFNEPIALVIDTEFDRKP
jgi:polyisoprenoid-binding protein YceI